MDSLVSETVGKKGKKNQTQNSFTTYVSYSTHCIPLHYNSLFPCYFLEDKCYLENGGNVEEKNTFEKNEE